MKVRPWSLDWLFNGPRLYWLIPGILPSFILSHSRGAFVAVACALLIWLWQRSRWAVFAIVPLGLSVVTAFGSMGSIHDRLTLWTDILPHLTIMGHGLGSFFTLYPIYSSFDTLIQRPEHLHNDWLEYGFETGAVGFVSMFGFAGAVYSRGGFMSRAALGCLAIEACFGFPTHMAGPAIMGALVAGHATRNGLPVRDQLNGWRISLRQWLQQSLRGFSGKRPEGRGTDIPAELPVS